MRTSWIIAAAILGFTSSSWGQDAKIGTLKVVIEGIKETKGKLNVALEKDAQDFDGGSLHEAKYRGTVVEVTGAKMEVEFRDLPFGTYAIKTFHDANGDGKLNSNMLGVPTEDYGFSNNVRGTLGPAKYKDAAFTFDTAEKTLTITVK